MVKGKCKKLTSTMRDHWPSSDVNTPTTGSSGYINTPKNQDSDVKSYLMMLVEDFKKGINNSLKEIQENTAKIVEALK
jgi:exonuclease V gamma subunit